MTEGTEGFVLGVDLGTSHTVAMLRRPDGRTRPLLFDGRPLLPSAVYLDVSGRMHVGPDALRLGHADPARLEPHPKRHVDEGRVLLGDAEPPVADLLAAVLSAVAREAVATVGFLPPAVLTYPASWGAPRREVLFEALGKAGWPRESRLLPEPVAAASYFADVLRRPVPAGSSLAVFDFGGGTLDVAVARNEGPGPDGRPQFAVIASGGDDNLGGLDLDAALVDHLGKGLSGGEPQAWRALTTPSTLAQWRARRDFWESVRGAKEMLSRSSFAPIPVPGVEQAVHLTRDELEAAADPLIRRAVAETHAVIAAAGIAPADLAGLFLVGGSSRTPLAARLLHSHLGIAPTVIEQPEFPVAEGATLVGSVSVAKAFAPGLSTAATPTPTPPTLPQQPPPITDTRADSAPITPTMPPEAVDAAGPAATDIDLSGVAAPERAGSGGDRIGSDAHNPPNYGGPRAPGAAAGPTPAQRDAEYDDRVYAEPVDPWATAEAAAIAAGGHGLYPGSPTDLRGGPGTSPTSFPGAPGSASTSGGSPGSGPPGSGPPGSGPRRRARALFDFSHGGPRRKAYVIGAGALVVLLVVGGVLFWVLRPGDRALAYQPLSVVRKVSATIDLSLSPFTDAEVIGDRIYFASSDYTSGKIEVVAIDAGATKPAWRSLAATSTTTAATSGAADHWASMTALPAGVALLTSTDSNSNKRLVMLSAKDGHQLWERVLDSSDDIYFVGGMAVVHDDDGHQLLGLRLDTGAASWKRPDLTAQGTTTSIFVATSAADLDGPATVGGRPLDPDPNDDTIVQVSADNSARLINAKTGVIGPSAQGVAGTDDEVVAHDGRLIVRQSDGTERILSYPLDKLGEPTVLYTAQSGGSHLTDLTPCGDRICFIEEKDYDAKTATVTAVGLKKPGRVWHTVVAQADGLVPVGRAVLATSSSTTTLLDGSGAKVWSNDGVAARLDGGNLLEFAGQLSTSTLGAPSVAGRHLGDQPVQLGPLRDIRSSTCSWNKSVIACAADKDFEILRFTK